ncbi:phytanoyl-CoA dioxygenase family protein [Nocardia sp. CNY236]|uniref:phytanoyl-CoA dioxygenase family protein n=1 Tax=Nocardia sp. CNY236 TaxID=1169152 RepID=UPI0018CAC13E|nr:phytanoyl-CoA dioxygenase family protein [Nocardia sp. CNY236]
MKLDSDRLEDYHRDGFLSIAQLVDGRRLRTIQDAAADVFDEADKKAPRKDRVLVPRGTHPAFEDNAAIREAAEVAEQILGGPAVRLFDMIMRRTPHSIETTPWHQDMAYTASPAAPAGIENSLQSLQFCMPLDDSALTSGCIEFLPGRHLEPLLEHRLVAGSSDDPTRVLEIVGCGETVDVSDAVRAPLPAGGVTVHNLGTPHYTGDDAATALQEVINLRRDAAERPFIDDLTGQPVHYLFMKHGKLLSTYYLFDTPIQQACKAVGLVLPGGRGGSGRGTVTAHRFRHTVGTQLAERGAKLHTIMKVLGHSSVNMALVYAQISDREVLRDYQSVLEPGAAIAGPAAADLKSGVLPDEAVDWLKSNFFKTELELGHCLRLPQEGPCECDLYLSCAKFVTTPAYAPRLRARRRLEHNLAVDAADRGWQREVERHRCTAERIERLLTDLGEELDQPADPSAIKLDPDAST